MDTLQTTQRARITSAERLEGGVIRIYMRANGREFRRLHEPGLQTVWMAGSYTATPKEQRDLERIFWAIGPEGQYGDIVRALPRPAPKKVRHEAPERFVRTRTTLVDAPAEKEPKLSTNRDVDNAQRLEREKQIIRCMAMGRTREETAAALDMNQRTLDGVIARIQAAHGAKNPPHLVRIALEKRMIGTTVYPDVPRPLTERERDILIKISNGWTNQEIADKLALSVKIIFNIVADLRGEWHAENTTELVAMAFCAKVIV